MNYYELFSNKIHLYIIQSYNILYIIICYSNKIPYYIERKQYRKKTPSTCCFQEDLQ